MTTGTWADLQARVQALAGLEAFNTTEETLLATLINRRARLAYNASQTWARYLTVGQARPGPLSVIPFTYTANDGDRTISASTRAADLVTVTVSADIDGDFVTGQFLTMAGQTGTVEPDGSYQVTVTGDRTFTYELDTTNTGSETYTLAAATAQPDDLSDVDTFIRVHETQPFYLDGAREFDFYTQSNGAHVIGNTGSNPGFWVTYKKKWDGPYDSSSNDDLPFEWFDYIAHAVYADWLRMNKQTEKARAEEQVAEMFLMLELDKPINQFNASITSRISTHMSRQSR